MASRIGVITGTFEPFHIGHMSIGFYALSKLDMDYLVYIPVLQGPGRMPAKCLPDRTKTVLINRSLASVFGSKHAEALFPQKNLQDAVNNVLDLSNSHFNADEYHPLDTYNRDYFLFMSHKLSVEELGITLPERMSVVPFPRPITPCSSAALRILLASDDPDDHVRALEWLPGPVRDYYAKHNIYKDE